MVSKSIDWLCAHRICLYLKFKNVYQDSCVYSVLARPRIDTKKPRNKIMSDIKSNIISTACDTQTCKQSNRSNRKVINLSQLRCNSNSNRLKFYLLHLLLSIIFLLQFTLCDFSEGGCRKSLNMDFNSVMN